MLLVGQGEPEKCERARGGVPTNMAVVRPLLTLHPAGRYTEGGSERLLLRRAHLASVVHASGASEHYYEDRGGDIVCQGELL